MSLVAELRRVFHSSEGMMLLAMYHGQVSVDGYVMHPRDDLRWTKSQLSGRMAKMPGREAALFGGGRIVSSHNTTQVEAR